MDSFRKFLILLISVIEVFTFLIAYVEYTHGDIDKTVLCELVAIFFELQKLNIKRRVIISFH